MADSTTEVALSRILIFVWKTKLRIVNYMNGGSPFASRCVLGWFDSETPSATALAARPRTRNPAPPRPALSVTLLKWLLQGLALKASEILRNERAVLTEVLDNNRCLLEFMNLMESHKDKKDTPP